MFLILRVAILPAELRDGLPSQGDSRHCRLPGHQGRGVQRLHQASNCSILMLKRQ